MTKFYCLAGLRLGYLLCHRDTLGQLIPLGEPWSVNTLAQKAGVFCLAQEDYAARTRETVNQWRGEMEEELGAMGFTVHPSQVNFLLVRLPPEAPNASQTVRACAAQGVLLRDCDSFAGCGDRYMRLAVTSPQVREVLYPVLKKALGI